MTEEVLQAAILHLRSRATERFAIIKDLYHRPATEDTVDNIVKHSLALAQLEGAMITLQQYAAALGQQTELETISNTPPTPSDPTELPDESTRAEAAEEKVEFEQEIPPVRHEELSSRSAYYRRSTENRPRIIGEEDDE
tara:strand:+ start:297 stop:713 length:417 start_codon:yes stop_codon:yes gene_type:complete